MDYKEKTLAMFLLYVGMLLVHNLVIELPAEVWAMSIIVVCLIIGYKKTNLK